MVMKVKMEMADKKMEMMVKKAVTRKMVTKVKMEMAHKKIEIMI